MVSGLDGSGVPQRVQVPGSVPEGSRGPAAGHSFAHGEGHGADAASDRMGSIRGATTPALSGRTGRGGGQTCGTTAHPITTVPAHADAAATAVECGRGRGDRART